MKFVLGNKAQDALLTHTENISVGGVGIIVKKEIALSTFVEIEIDLLDGGDPIQTHGKVAWVSKRKATENIKPLFFDVGLEFVGLDPKDVKRLACATDNLIKKGHKVLRPLN